MRTNGFIIIALSLTAGAWAGTSGYLPGVGPVALRFERELSYRVTLPKPTAEPASHSPPLARENFTAELPVVTPTNPPTVPLMQDTPIAAPAPGTEPAVATPTDPSLPLISPMTETNGVVTPQMFLRFFTGPRDGSAAEAVIAVPPNFTPGFGPTRPPGPPSTATLNHSNP